MAKNDHAQNNADIESFAARLGHAFADIKLLNEALTHPSAREGRPGPTYERLEFLGDRVLGLVVAETLYLQFPYDREGGLAKRLNNLVNRHACARAARRADLGAMIHFSKAELEAGGAEREASLANACESVIGAIYLDGGLDAVRAFITRFWADELRRDNRPPTDPKTALQEWAAARKRQGPHYDVVAREGPDHEPRFVVEVRVEGMKAARAEGASKRDAERAAALLMLQQAGADV